MPKRFTDTDKWKKPFIRGLQGAYKLLWFYICDDCDHAGIWQVDMEVAEIRIGEKITISGAIKCFGGKIIPIDGGRKWFIPSFIEFQYPSGLNPENKAHSGAIAFLKKYDLIDSSFKVLESPLQGDKDMVKDMEMEMDKEKVKVKVKEKEVFVNPFSEIFLTDWNKWKEYKKTEFNFKYKSVISEQSSINELVKLSGGSEMIAKQIIDKSITKGWKGFFELKNDNQNGRQQTTTGQSLREGVQAEFEKRFRTGQ